MAASGLPRILVVDDEEAILETMTFTFMDSYDVLTASNGARALEILEEKSPISVVITDQRMPEMTGVELLAQVFERYPETMRIMLTGFADADATIQAINDGHIYAYINKPWEPTELKQVVARAIDYHRLATENSRLVADLRESNLFLTAVMDRLEVGAIAVDADGVIRAVNRPAREYLPLDDVAGKERLAEVLEHQGLGELSKAATNLLDASGGSFEELDLPTGAEGRRIRVSAQSLAGADGAHLGRVILFKEISHEPLRRRFEEIVSSVTQIEEGARASMEGALAQLGELSSQVETSDVASPLMAELSERVSRTRTALQNWLDVDDQIATEDFPDAQLLLDRLRVATQRWPYPSELPKQVRALAVNVEDYYESGENPKKRVL